MNFGQWLVGIICLVETTAGISYILTGKPILGMVWIGYGFSSVGLWLLGRG